jgi:hypothetical protein
VRGKAVRRNDVIDRSLNVRRPEALLGAELAGFDPKLPVGYVRFSYANVLRSGATIRKMAFRRSTNRAESTWPSLSQSIIC